MLDCESCVHFSVYLIPLQENIRTRQRTTDLPGFVYLFVCLCFSWTMSLDNGLKCPKARLTFPRTLKVFQVRVFSISRDCEMLEVQLLSSGLGRRSALA